MSILYLPSSNSTAFGKSAAVICSRIFIAPCCTSFECNIGCISRQRLTVECTGRDFQICPCSQITTLRPTATPESAALGCLFDCPSAVFVFCNFIVCSFVMRDIIFRIEAVSSRTDFCHPTGPILHCA